MGFSPEITERIEKRSQWITTPGWHTVEIGSWRYGPQAQRRYVVFQLQDGQGRKQSVCFSLSTPVLREGELLRFVLAATRWDKYDYMGSELSIAKAMTFRKLVGRSVRVFVHEARRGLHDVLDWEPVDGEPDA